MSRCFATTSANRRPIEELEAMSGNKRRARLDAIKDACQAYIYGPLRAELTGSCTTGSGPAASMRGRHGLKPTTPIPTDKPC